MKTPQIHKSTHPKFGSEALGSAGQTCGFLEFWTFGRARRAVRSALYSDAPSRRRSTGFTITELLVVMAIIAILIAMVLATVRGVRSAGSRADSLNSLRQMVAGYNSYTSENRQRLMPGFVHPDHITDDVPLDARLEDGRYLIADPNLGYPEDVGPYVWRLAPYVGHDWSVFFTDYRSSGTVSTLQSEYGDDVFGPGSHSDGRGIAMMPAFGLNSIFLGGDTTHGGDAARSHNPLTGSGYGEDGDRWAATRLSQVRNPSNIIVFGPTGRARDDAVSFNEVNIYQTGPFGHEMGYFELRPPFTGRDVDGRWENPQWRIRLAPDAFDPDSPSAPLDRQELQRLDNGEYSFDAYGAGLPIARWGAGHYPVAHLDGSATTIDLERIALDMRHWSPFAVGLNVPTFVDPRDFPPTQ